MSMKYSNKHSSLPYSRTGYWVRQQGETEWEDASDYTKYAYGKFYDEEDVAQAYMNYIHEHDSEITELTVEILNSEDKIYTYDAYVEYRASYYADHESIRDFYEDE